MPWVALVLLVCVSVPVWPQASSSTGAIEGWIVDASQAAVAIAPVEVRNQGTGLTRRVESDARGYYRVGELPVGDAGGSWASSSCFLLDPKRRTIQVLWTRQKA